MSELVSTFESALLEKFHSGNGSALSTLQSEAIAKASSLGLPKLKTEAYKFTSITRILEKNIDLTPARVSNSFDFKAAFYAVEEANHLVFVNGEFDPSNSVIKSAEKDLKIVRIDSTNYDSYENLKALGKVEIGQSDVFNILNLGLFKSGLYLEASRKSENLPVFIYHFVDSEVKAVFPRIFIHAESMSTLDVYEKLFVNGTDSVFFNHSIETEVKEGGNVSFTKIQNYPKNVFSVESTYGHILRDAHFYTNTYSFGAGLVRNNVGISIDGENCEGHMNGLYQLSGETHVDNNTAVDHRKPHSFSNELYKGILDEKSRGVFNGRIYVRPDAQKTNAFQSNNNILLSEAAVINTKPQLEIWADDVKCSHGCTTGQLDEEAIFYLRSRGIEKNQAKALLLNAFANETLQSVKEDLVRTEIEHLILNKLGQ